ncbi:MAG: helix-turn-helix domain-containing protein [Chloroflexi bacterium]|nr:helix-turn-helix domain-containing protein [Chloroflexota bacterium]
MNVSEFTNSFREQQNGRNKRLKSAGRSAVEYWKQYLAVVVSGVAAVLLVVALGGTTWPVALLAALLVVAATAWHADFTARLRTAMIFIDRLEQRLVFEANSSRVLAGVRQLTSLDSRSADARLASAARLSTEYPAAVVFNLNSAQHVFAPASWSYDGPLAQVRDEFEAIDGDTPGAVASRQGSAIVMSLTDPSCTSLPKWAEQAGFSQGIVAPVTRGLDTTAVVYVLNKSSLLPSLAEIEQFELVINFNSGTTAAMGTVSYDGFSGTNSRQQPFRIMENSSTRQSFAESDIRMPGFALDTGLERMNLDGIAVTLSPTEFSLIHALASSPGRAMSHDQLMSKCWSDSDKPADNAVDVAIFRLRRKLNKTTSGKDLIRTVRGSGYMFVPPAVIDRVGTLAD